MAIYNKCEEPVQKKSDCMGSYFTMNSVLGVKCKNSYLNSAEAL